MIPDDECTPEALENAEGKEIITAIQMKIKQLTIVKTE